MAVAVVDSNVLIDYKNTASSDRHERAEKIIHGIDSGNLPKGRVTNYVLLEVLNWIHTRERHDIAVDLNNRLTASAGFEIVHAPQKDFTRAVELFEKYDGLAFGDATIGAFMEREEIEFLYSFDSDFDVLNHVTRLTEPENPFE